MNVHVCNEATNPNPYYCVKCGRQFKPDAPQPETARVFYVSIIDGTRKALVCGPFAAHQDALEAVAPVREYVMNHYMDAAFYAFGTAGYVVSDGAKPPTGKLNAALEIEVPAFLEVK